MGKEPRHPQLQGSPDWAHHRSPAAERGRPICTDRSTKLRHNPTSHSGTAPGIRRAVCYVVGPAFIKRTRKQGQLAQDRLDYVGGSSIGMEPHRLSRHSRVKGLCRGILDPGPEQPTDKRVFSVIESQQVFDNFHISAAEIARWPMAEDVSLSSVILDWIGATEALEGTVCTSRQRFHTRSSNESSYHRPSKYVLVRVFKDIAESKRLIAHLRQHPSLVRGVYISIVVVHHGSDPHSKPPGIEGPHIPSGMESESSSVRFAHRPQAWHDRYDSPQ